MNIPNTALIRLAEDLGRQAGGWKRQQHPTDQNAEASAPRQRAQTLSTCAALKARFKWLASATRRRKFHHSLEGRRLTVGRFGRLSEPGVAS